MSTAPPVVGYDHMHYDHMQELIYENTLNYFPSLVVAYNDISEQMVTGYTYYE